MGQEYRQYDGTNDTLDKIERDTLILTDKVRDVNHRIKKTPWYRIVEHLKLYKELRNLGVQADDIGERLKMIKENPIQVVRRT